MKGKKAIASGLQSSTPDLRSVRREFTHSNQELDGPSSGPQPRQQSGRRQQLGVALSLLPRQRTSAADRSRSRASRRPGADLPGDPFAFADLRARLGSGTKSRVIRRSILATVQRIKQTNTKAQCLMAMALLLRPRPLRSGLSAFRRIGCCTVISKVSLYPNRHRVPTKCGRCCFSPTRRGSRQKISL